MKPESVLKAIKEIRNPEKKRKFDQSIDLIINLKNFDVRRESFSLFIQVPNKIKDKKVAGFLENKSDLVHTIKKEDFPRYKEKKDIRKLIKGYDFFIANAKLMPAIATNFGRVLGPVGKMPSPQLGILPMENPELIKNVIEKINSTVKVKLKEPSIKVSIGRESLTDEQVVKNVLAVYNKILETLPKKRENVKNVLIKLCMGKPVHVEF